MKKQNNSISESCYGILDFGIFQGGTLALVRRIKQGMGPKKTQWKLPGGWCEKYEKPEDAIRRVIFQAVGIRCTPKTQTPFSTEIIKNIGKPYRFSVWIMDVCAFNPQSLITKHDIAEIKFFTLSELFEELKLEKKQIMRRGNIVYHHKEHVLTYLNTIYTPPSFISV